MVKLYIFDEFVIEKSNTETEFVNLNHLIFEVNLVVKPMLFCANTASN